MGRVFFMIRLKWHWWYLLILLLCLMWGAVGFNRLLQFEKLERQVFDWHVLRQDFPAPEFDIVLVLAGEDTLSWFGEWPWPRRYHAKLLGRLGYARAILLDILFPQKSTPEDDDALVEVVGVLGNVVLPMHLDSGPPGDPPRIITPFRELVQTSAGIGFTDVERDIDALTRFAMPVMQIGELMVPSFPLAAIPVISEDTLQLQQTENDAYLLSLGSRDLPIDSQGRLWIHFSKQPYETYEYYEVMSGEISPETFRDKIVVVGVAASGVEDLHTIPCLNGSRVITGTQLNAEILRTVLSGKAAERFSPLSDGIITAILACFGAFFAVSTRPIRGLVGMVGICLVYAGLNHYIFTQTLQWPALVVPTMGIVSTFFVVFFVRFRWIHRDWEVKTLSIFSVYDLARKGDASFEDFEAYIKSVWPQVEKNTGVKLLSSRITIQDAMGERATGFESGSVAPGENIIMLEDGNKKPRNKMLIPIPRKDFGDDTEYALLGWSGRLSRELIQTLAAMVLSSSWFFSLLVESQERKKLLLDTIHAIFTAVDAKDPITGGHSNRVSEITLEILQHLNLDPKTVEDIHLGSLIHDIGKIGIPDSVLTKKGKLTQEEYVIIRDHPVIGKRIVDSVRLPENTLRTLHEHHERFDGKGYPVGLEGDRISLAARIVAVADVFDALTNDRPYRKGLPVREVCDFLYERAGKDFDPAVVKAILELRAPPGWIPPEDRDREGEGA